MKDIVAIAIVLRRALDAGLQRPADAVVDDRAHRARPGDQELRADGQQPHPEHDLPSVAANDGPEAPEEARVAGLAEGVFLVEGPLGLGRAAPRVRANLPLSATVLARPGISFGLPLGGPMDTDAYRILHLDFPVVFGPPLRPRARAARRTQRVHDRSSPSATTAARHVGCCRRVQPGIRRKGRLLQ
jgi:hypothetical protein